MCHLRRTASYIYCLLIIVIYNIALNFLQAVLVGSRESLTERNDVLDTTHEILERFEAHLRAIGQYMV